MIFDFLTGGVSGLMPNGLNRIDADDPELSDYNMVPGMPTHSPRFFDLVATITKAIVYRFILVIEIIYLLRIHRGGASFLGGKERL